MARDRKEGELYDAYYFATGCGRPYQRDAEWLGFFGTIADRIVSDIGPKTVLDAGCAMGFLVEALRERGVESYGIDISEYAIDRVHESVRDCCWVGSVTEPFPQSYDLIVCIEVLEHLPAEKAQAAVANLCKHSDDIVFSSTPFDYKEATHFNVQPPEYWAEAFARHGFLRDLDFDSSIISPWAFRSRRRQESIPRVVREYERRFWPLWQENVDLREMASEMRAELAKLSQERSAMQVSLEEAQQLRGRLAEIEAHIGWRILTRIQKLRVRLFPIASRRERIWKLGVAFLRAWLNLGLVGALSKTIAALRGRPIGRVSAADYDRWIRSNEPSASDLAGQRAMAREFGYRPLISVITLVYNPPPSVLEAAIESVIAQTYDKWELCLVDGNSTDPEVGKLLRAYADGDDRIKVRMLENNKGIAGNSQQGLEMSVGDFVLLLDHDDVLAPNTLFEIATSLNVDRSIDLVYFDEDKLSEDGRRRSDPWFKPDWSPELLLSANYLMHSAIRRDLVNSVGGFDATMDGAQDWDLVLRCTERSQAIHHIPKILYHWRQVRGSAAASLMAKPWVFERQLRAVTGHLRRTGRPGAEAAFVAPGFIRLRWPFKQPLVSIIVPTRDQLDCLRRCLESILSHTRYPEYEILLVDSGSQDPETWRYYDALKADGRARVVEIRGGFNFSAANNLGAREARGGLLLFLNNDTEVLEPDWLEELAQWALWPEIGAVGAKLLYPDGLVQHAGVILGMEGHASHVFWRYPERQSGPFGSVDWYRNYMAVTGACTMVRRQVFEEVGGFDEGYQLVFSDVDFCLKVHGRGYRILYTPHARLRHYEGRSRSDYIPPHDIRRGYEVMLAQVEQGDPYFNPNLSYGSRQPRLALKGEEGRGDRLRRLLRVHAQVLRTE